MAVSTAKGMVQGPESSATFARVSATPVGASFTSVTVIEAVVPPLIWAPAPSRAALIVKVKVSPAGVLRSAAGVNFRPAPAWAVVMKLPLAISVVPLFS